MTDCKLPQPKTDLITPGGFNLYPQEIGAWELDPKVLVLRNKANGYEVDLERINNRRELIDWIFHMSGKNALVYGGCQYLPDLINFLSNIYERSAAVREEWSGYEVAQDYIQKAFKAHLPG